MAASAASVAATTPPSITRRMLDPPLNRTGAAASQASVELSRSAPGTSRAPRPRARARLDAREERADDERRVLRPDLAVERARERLPDQRGLAEAGEGVEVALLLLGGRGGAKAAEKLVVACPVARVRQDRDERG